MIKRYSEITDVVVDDFRRQVISSILSMFPDRAVDDEDTSNGVFYMDGVKVEIESDRIVIDGDSKFIPLKNPPIAGNPPQYRPVEDIISDFVREFSTLMTEEEQEVTPITSIGKALAGKYGISDTGCYINGAYFSPRSLIQKIDELGENPSYGEIEDCITGCWGAGKDGRYVNNIYMSPDSVLEFISSRF